MRALHVRRPPLMSSPSPFPIPADEHDADQARQRFARRRYFFQLRRHRQPPKHLTVSHIEVAETFDLQPITLSDPLPTSDDDYQHKFVWAVLYENQRGSVLL